MRRITQREFGSADVLEVEDGAEQPVPGDGEVLVEVKAAGVNPIDVKIRSGRDLLGPPPFTLGFDLSGVVVSGDGFNPGHEVFGMIGFPERAGCYAEFVAAPADQLLAKPALLTHEQAAAVPLASLTAWQALVGAAEIQPGERVLVHAGAGGVGHFAIQIAKARGAHVITTASSAKHDFVAALGADEMIDYHAVDFAEELSGSLDVVFDTVGSGTAARSIPALKPGGRLITITEYRDEELPVLASDAGVGYHGVVVTPSAADLAEIVKLVEAGQLHIELAAVLALENADKAHQLSETQRTTGKIVLLP